MPTSRTRYDDNDPIWERYDPRPGYEDPEWGEADQDRAAAFYHRTEGRRRDFLDLLINRPGQLVSAEEIAIAMGVDPDSQTGRHAVAGSLSRLRELMRDSGRRYPFYCFRQNNASILRGMKPSVAALFAAARRSLPDAAE